VSSVARTISSGLYRRVPPPTMKDSPLSFGRQTKCPKPYCPKLAADDTTSITPGRGELGSQESLRTFLLGNITSFRVRDDFALARSIKSSNLTETTPPHAQPFHQCVLTTEILMPENHRLQQAIGGGGAQYLNSALLSEVEWCRFRRNCVKRSHAVPSQVSGMR